MPQNEPDKSLWTRKIEADPDHSLRFAQRFRDMRAAGQDIVGEARFVDAMAPRGARILDAGCGSGRIGGPLVASGHTVVGVDVDPVLIEIAREDYPDATWLVGDLARLDVSAAELTPAFDVIVSAGNVMPFLAPSTRRDVLSRLRSVLTPQGRAAVGFGAGRGYPFAEFFADCSATGWSVPSVFRGWNMLPFEPDSEFLVAILARAARGRSAGTVAAAHHRTADGDPMGGNTLAPL